MLNRLCAWSVTMVPAGACGTATGVMRAHEAFPDPKLTPMARAVALGDTRRVARLAAEGVDVNARGDRGTTLLQWALLTRSTASMSTLLEAGADPALADDAGATVVHFAALANDPAYLELLLAKGADPNTPNGVTGATPLVSALMGLRERQFRMLLAAGADPGRPDRMGDTPLHMAAKINQPARVLDLLEAGAPPEARNGRGMTFQRYLFVTPEHVLSDQARRGRAEVIDWLRRHDVAVERPSGA